MSKVKLCANYRKVGNKLFSDSHTLLIKERLKTRGKKTKKFLLELLPNNKMGDYISSLFPTDKPNVYSLDYNGVYYKLTLLNDSAHIQ